MSIKKNLMIEIEKKAQKIREKRIEAANNKTLEIAVFDFFRNIEECRKIHNNARYDHVLFAEAKRSLEERLRVFDFKIKVSVEFNVSEDLTNWEEQLVRGVTLWWSKSYIKKNNVHPSLYIDVSQMLFI
jgi:hypothetical protein